MKETEREGYITKEEGEDESSVIAKEIDVVTMGE